MPEDFEDTADSSTAQTTGSSDADEASDQGSDLDDTGAQDDAGALLEGNEDDDEAEIPAPYHTDPAWKRIQQKRIEADTRAADAERQAAEAKQWADIALATARKFGFNTAEEYAAATAEADKIAEAQAEADRKAAAQREEDAKRAEYIQKYGDTEIVETLMDARRERAEAQAIRQQNARETYNQTLAKAKEELGALYDDNVDLLIKSFRASDVPKVVNVLKKLASPKNTPTEQETIARAEAAKAAARREQAPKPDSGRGATPGAPAKLRAPTKREAPGAKPFWNRCE